MRNKKPKLKIKKIKSKIKEISEVKEKNLESELSREEFQKFSDFMKMKSSSSNAPVLRQNTTQQENSGSPRQIQETRTQSPQRDDNEIFVPRPDIYRPSERATTYQGYMTAPTPGAVATPRKDVAPVLRQDPNSFQRQNDLQRQQQFNQEPLRAIEPSAVDRRQYETPEEQKGMSKKRREDWSR